MTATLARQQRALAALVRDEADIADDAPAVAALLRPLAGAAPRLGIYRGAYRGRLVEALRSNYPVLHRVLGDDDFAALALAWLAGHPSRVPSIRWFGRGLPDWLAGRLEADPDALPHPALADLARMEWAVGSSFDAADAPPLDRERLAAIEPARWPALRFAAHPSLHIVDLAWAVEPLWRALTDDEHAATEPPEPRVHRLLVWRQGLETRWRALPVDEAEALAACVTGVRFDALCERIAAADPQADAAACAAGWLGQWVAAGLLAEAGEAA
jgi:hypothetical protein